MSEILAIIGLAIKLALIIFEKTKSTDTEIRRAELAKLDAAIEKAKVDKDLTDLSKWMGSKL